MNYEEKQDFGEYIIHTRIYPKPVNLCGAISNDTTDNKHIVLLDYDDCQFDVVMKDIAYLIEQWELGPFFIYLTGPSSWHVRCPAKLTFYELTKVISECHTDPYILDELTGYKRKNAHRVSKRGSRMAPTLIKVIKMPTQFEISKCHWDFFLEDCEEDLSDFEKLLVFDSSKLENTPVVVYGTAKEADGSYGKN